MLSPYIWNNGRFPFRFWVTAKAAKSTSLWSHIPLAGPFRQIPNDELFGSKVINPVFYTVLTIHSFYLPLITESALGSTDGSSTPYRPNNLDILSLPLLLQLRAISVFESVVRPTILLHYYFFLKLPSIWQLNWSFRMQPACLLACLKRYANIIIIIIISCWFYEGQRCGCEYLPAEPS